MPRRRLHESEEKYRLLFEGSRDAIIVRDRSGRFLDCNEAALRLFKCRSKDDFTSTLPTDCSPEKQADGRDTATVVPERLAEVLREGTRFFEWLCKKHDGSVFPAEVLLSRLEMDGKTVLQSVIRDISERKQGEERIAQLNRVQAILAGVDHAIVHIADQQNLLDEICRVAVEKGGFKLAWIGMASSDGLVQPVAKAGAIAYLDAIRVSTRGDEPEGRGPVGTAIRENRPVEIVDVERDPRMAPWRERALRLGLHYTVVLPLRIAGKAVGSFQVYATRAGFFDENELRLLNQVSEDISFALKAIDDATRRKRAEEAIAESEAQLRAMFEVASIGIAQADPRTGQWLRVNQKLCAITGYTAEELLKVRFPDLTHPEDQQKDWEEFQRVVKGEAPDYRLEKRYIRKDGSVAWVNVNVAIIWDAAGQPVRTMAAIEDITERKASEQRIRQLSRAVEQSPISIFITDTKGDIQYVNPKFTEVTGYSPHEVLGKNPRLLNAGRQSPELYKQLWDTIIAGDDWRGELCNRKKNGELFWEFVVIAPIKDEHGMIAHFVALKEDITQRKRTERALAESTQRIEGIIGSAMDAVISVNAAQRIALFNVAAEKMFHCAASEALGSSIDRFIPMRFHAAHKAHIRRFGKTGVTSRKMGHMVPLSGVRTNGEEFPIEASISQIEIGGDKIYTVILRDVTERRRLEQEVLEISAREQQHLGRELHDDICQWLAATACIAGGLAKELAKESSENAARAREVADNTSHTLNSLRMLARGLTPAVIQSEGGLAGALRQLAVNAEEMFGIRCRCDCEAAAEVRDEIAALHLYRIAQEAISNAVRHGRARNVSILIRSRQGRVSMKIRDDGCGIPQPLPQTPGMGLRSMRYRAECIGATLEIRPGLRAGTEIVCTLPKHR